MAGFLSGMALATSDIDALLVHPFVIILKPAVAMSAQLDMTVVIVSVAKFCVLIFYLFMEMVVFLVVFVIAGLVAAKTMGVTETLPILYLLKWCAGLFLTMLPCVATM